MTPLPQSTSPCPPKELLRRGHWLHVDVTARLLRPLRTRMFLFRSVQGGNHQIVTNPHPFVGHVRYPGGRRHAYRVPAGLGPVVEELLRQKGISFRYEPAVEPLPEPALPLPVSFGPVDLEWLDLVRGQDRSLLRYREGVVEPARLVAQLARAWPQLRTAVVANTIDRARQLAAQIYQYIPRMVVVSSRNHPNPEAQVVVLTPAYLGRVSGMAKIDLLILADSLCVVGCHIEQIRSCPCRRLVGLLSLSASPSPYEKDRLAAWLGFRQLVIPWPGFRDRPVQVLQTRMTGRLPAGGEDDLASLKRCLVWDNPIRNRRLARLAQALSKGDGAVLDKFLLPAPVDRQVTSGGRVFLLVENVEHALRLAEALPGWPLLVASELNLTGLTEHQVRSLETRRWTLNEFPTQGIVTASCFASLPLSLMDVLVRGDAGVGLPPLSCHQLLQRVQEPPRPLFLVDCDDRFHPQLRRHWRLRQQAYLDRGWLPPGTDPVSTAVERFLTSRQLEDDGNEQ